MSERISYKVHPGSMYARMSLDSRGSYTPAHENLSKIARSLGTQASTAFGLRMPEDNVIKDQVVKRCPVLLSINYFIQTNFRLCLN